MQDKCFFFFLVLKNWVIVQPKFAKRRSHKVSRFGKVIRRNFKFFLKKTTKAATECLLLLQRVKTLFFRLFLFPRGRNLGWGVEGLMGSIYFFFLECYLKN